MVGVVRNPYLRNALQPVRSHVWTPYRQNPERIDGRFAVRVRGDPATMLPELVRVARAVDPAVPITETLTMAHQVDAAFRSVRTVGAATSYAGLLAMVLAGLGMYGLLTFTVNARRRTIAIRKALGAGSTDIAMDALAPVVAILGGGVLLGVVLALGTSRTLAHLLFGLSPWDAKVFAMAGGALLLVAAAACWPPVRRAVRIDPRDALAE